MDDRYRENNYPESNDWNVPNEHPEAYKLWLRITFGF